MYSLRSCSLLLAALASACVGPDIDYGEVRTVEVTQALADGYRLAAGDDIQVVFAYHPERTIQLTVRPDGKVSMPFAEEVTAAGLTVGELDTALTRNVEQHLRDPDLSVIVRGYAKQRIYIGGEVAVPKEQPLTPGLTVYQALAAAGWFKPSAATDSIVLVRQDGPGKRMAMKIDCSEEALISADVELMPFDIIYVPKTSISRVAEWVDEHINKVLPRAVTIAFLGFRFNSTVYGN